MGTMVSLLYSILGGIYAFAFSNPTHIAPERDFKVYEEKTSVRSVHKDIFFIEQETHTASLVFSSEDESIIQAIFSRLKGQLETSSFSSFKTKKAASLQEESLAEGSVCIYPLSSEEGVTLKVTYSPPFRPISNMEDLRHRWVQVLFQEMLQNRLKERVKDKIDFNALSKCDMVATRCISDFSVHCSFNNAAEILAVLLTELEYLKGTGFSEEELVFAKGFTQELILELLQESVAVTFSKDTRIHPSERINSLRCPAYQFFLNTSGDLIEEISLSDFSPEMTTAFIDVDQPLYINCPSSVLAETANFEFAENDYGNGLSAPIFLVSSVSNSFLELPLADWEKKLIYTIFTTMADKNVIQLAWEKKSLEKKGKKINPVHPMRLLGYVFSDPDLKKAMRAIKKSHFKWNGFIDGFSRRMKEEAGRNNLVRHIPGFCEQVGANPDEVRHYIDKHDWEGLARHLL